MVLALGRRGVRSVVCTYHHGREVEGVSTRRIPWIPGFTKREAGPSHYRYFADVLLFLKALVVAWRERPDVIHGHLHEGALVGWAVKSVLFWRRIPLVFDVQGSLVGEMAEHGYFERRPGLKRIFWKVEHAITRLPDFLVCSSGESAHVLRSEFGVDPNRIAVVHDGADADVVPASRAERLRKRLQVPDGEPVVVYAGALLAAKGEEALRQIVIEARNRNLPAHFLVVGYPEEGMREFVEAHDLEAFCTVTGRVPFEELSDYLGLGAVAVEPKEGNSGEASGKLLNYMAAELPVVCFDMENNRNLLGEAGSYVRRGDVVSFVEHVATLVRNPELRARKGRKGRERVRERFTWDASAERVEAVYAEHCP